MDKPFNQNLFTSNNDKALQNIQSLEQRLEVSEARASCLLTAIPQMAWLAQVNGAITNFNQRWYEYTGLTPEESRGWGFLDAIHPQNHDFLQDYLNSRLSSSQASEPTLDCLTGTVGTTLEVGERQNAKVECRIRGKDGTYSWFIAKKIPVLGASGQLLEWIGTFTLKTRRELHSGHNPDVPRQRLSLQLPVELTQPLSRGKPPTAKLQTRPAQHRVVELRQHRQPKPLAESQAIIWEAEATTGQFTYVSRSAERLLGYPITQWLNQPDFWLNLVHPDDRQWTAALYHQQMMRLQDYELEYRCITADQRVVWLRDRACVIRDAHGQVSKRRGLMVDITWVKLTETELDRPIGQPSVLAQTQVQAALEKHNRELEQLIYVLSHDLKAPLQAIATLSQWLEEDLGEQLDQENHYHMQLLRGRVQRLEALINSLLQYFRAGRLNDKPRVIDVAALLNQVIAALSPPPQFSIEVAPMPTLITRQSLLEQVFSQLIHNAIQHHPNPNGKVRISSQEQADVYEFAVTDNGVGIAPQFQERIFAIFQTLQARDQVENTGMGLAIAKKIVESQGGAIRVESQADQGATFYFTWGKSVGEHPVVDLTNR